MRATYVLVGVALLAAAMTAGPASSADASCDLGWAPTTGGVAEADLNGDGLTCEMDVLFLGLSALASADNAPPGPPAGRCPPGFRRDDTAPPGFAPDRNRNGVVCVKETPGERHDRVIIDDARRA